MSRFNPYNYLLEDTIGNLDYNKGTPGIDENKAEHKKRQLTLRLDQVISDIEFIKSSIEDHIDQDPAMVEEIKSRFATFFQEYEEAIPYLNILKYANQGAK